MKQYVDLVVKILEEGREKKDRTGVGTKSLFGHQSEYKMSNGFPLLTMKKTWFPGVVHELIWFLGNHMKLEEYKNLPATNIKYLTDNKVKIWNEWADKDGNLGPVYGEQWTKWVTKNKIEKISNEDSNFDLEITHKRERINQIQKAIDRLKTNPEDRGIIVSAWNVGELDKMALRPCHTIFQFYAEELTYLERSDIYDKMITERGGIDTDDLNTEKKFNRRGVPKHKLSLQLYQRSADTFLGVPFNIASYSLLLHMVAHVTNMVPGKFVHSFGDAHLYLNHKDQVNELLQRTLPEDNIKIDFWQKKDAGLFIGNNFGPALPQIKLNPEIKDIFNFQYSDIELIEYNPLKVINAPIAV
jgi:thymidylate synthase